MLAYHKPETFMAARGNDTPGNGFIRSMSFAVVEAGEHVLATAKSLLRPVPKAGLRVALVGSSGHEAAREADGVGRRQCPIVDGGRGPPCRAAARDSRVRRRTVTLVSFTHGLFRVSGGSDSRV
jgi:hypothetical protein